MIPSPIAGLRAARALRVTGALLGLAAIGVYLVIALARLSYPFTVEVLESNSLVEVHRILAGQPLYVLLAGFRPARAIPPAGDRAVGLRLVMAIRELGGTVAIPADPGLALTAGLPAVEDQIAAADVLHGKDQAAMAAFTGSVAAAVAARRFSAIITELPRDLRGFPPDLPRYYRLCPQMPLAGVPPAPFNPGPGGEGHSVSVWVPAGGASCVAAISALERPDSPARPGVPADQEGRNERR